MLTILACALVFPFLSFIQSSSRQPTPAYSFRIKQSANKTWGYEIFKGEKLLIDQPTIPGVPGGNGFVDAKQASLVAKKVIQKLNKGIFPPQIEQNELKQWKITIKP